MNKKALNTTSLIIGSAMSLAISTATISVPAAAQDVEHCYGVAKAGKNDCQTANSSCAGTSKHDSQPDAFVLVPAGTCAKIAGGSTEAP